MSAVRPRRPAAIETEVAVIGGGICGASTAYHLARLGRDVVLLERDAIASHASGLNSGIIGAIPRSGAPDLAGRLATSSLATFRSLQLDLGYDIGFRQSGSLRVIRTDAEHEHARQVVSQAGPAGNGVELLDGRDARALEPGLDPALLGAIHSSLTAQADPVEATRALARAAARHGCRVRIRHEVTAITAASDSTYRIQAGSRTVAARVLVIAAGPWTRRVGAFLGLDIPIVPVRGQMWATASLPPRLFHTLSALESALHWHRHPPDAAEVPALTHRGESRLTRHLYGRQTRAGPIIFGGDRQLADLTAPPLPDPAGIEVNRAHAAEILPLLRSLPIRRTWSGLMPFSPDGHPTIGPIRSRPNLYVVGGMGSSGFGEGPAAGRLLAEWIQGSAPPAGSWLAEADPARCVRETG